MGKLRLESKGKLRLVPALAASIAAIAALAFAPSAAQASTPEFLGAATHPLWDSSVADSDRELDMLVDAGANVVRIDLSWSSLQQGGADGYAEWYVEKADTFFEHARARGLRAIATFWATPCWASSAPETLKQGCSGAWWERGVQLYPPTNPADFARAAAWVAERWGADLAALEIWNEPNCTCFFTSSAPVSDYAALLKSSYASVKQVAPGLHVLGASLQFSDGAFLDALYREGIGGHLDGVSVRPFSQGRDPADPTLPPGGRKYSYLHGVPWLREVMVAHGDAAKELWFTELGWSSCAPGGTSQWCVTLDQQARYIAAAFRIIRDRWDFVRAASVYNLRNKGTSPTDRESQMGLLHRDFAPKPSYWAFGDVLAELAANPLPRDAEAGPAGGQAQGGTAAGQASTAVLHSGPAADLTAPVLTGLRIRPRVLQPSRRRARIGFSVSEPARVKLTLERVKSRAGCLPHCAHWADLRGSLVHHATAGRNRIRFTGRLRGNRLGPGRYQLSAVARDAAGNASAVKRTRFRIVP
jgi:polysaccharide biosynthesis protein PslG